MGNQFEVGIKFIQTFQDAWGTPLRCGICNELIKEGEVVEWVSLAEGDVRTLRHAGCRLFSWCLVDGELVEPNGHLEGRR